MKSISFGGFEAGFVDALRQSAFEHNVNVNIPGMADIHLHLNPDHKKIAVNPDTVIALIAEPKIVRPDMYRTRIMKKFLECLTISRVRAEKLGLENVMELPIKPPSIFHTDAKRDRKICLVAGHKFSASRLSNYGLRRKVLSSKFGGLIDLYGPDWFDPFWLELQRRVFAARLQFWSPTEFSIKEFLGDFGKSYTNYRGIMDADFRMMNRYELSLVVENQSDYISEKIWISLARGAVPIYVGPALNEFNEELADAVFQVEAKPEAILEVLNNASPAEIELKRSAGFSVLESNWMTSRNDENVARKFIRYFKEKYG